VFTIALEILEAYFKACKVFGHTTVTTH